MRNQRQLTLAKSARWNWLMAAVCSLVFTQSLCLGQSFVDNPAAAQAINQQAKTNLNVNRLEKIQFADQFSGATADVKLNAAITALGGSGGIVMATSITGTQTIAATVKIPANVTVWLGPATYQCTITNNTDCWWLQGQNASLLGLGSGDSNGYSTGADPLPTDALGVTNLICSGCSSQTSMIRVNSSDRSSRAKEIIGDAEVGRLWINMGTLGFRALYATSVNDGNFHDITAFNCAEDCFNLEGGLSTDIQNGQAYHDTLTRLWLQPGSSNTTGAALHIDARQAEIAWLTITAVRASGNILTGGGAQGLLLDAGTSRQYQGINKVSISSSYFGNVTPAATVPNGSCSGIAPSCGGFGVQFRASGNIATGTDVGQIRQVQVNNTLVERLFRCSGKHCGTAIGATDAANNPYGLGVHSVIFISINYGANWTTQVDYANIGQNEAELGDDAHGYSGYGVSVRGEKVGRNPIGFYSNETWIPDQDGEAYFGILSRPIVNSGTGTETRQSLVAYGGYFDGLNIKLRGTGTVARAYGLYASQPTIAANNYAIWADGSVNVNGNFSATSKSFKIDHPLDPANKYLYHTSVESPDMMNIYNGVIVLDAHGQGWVQLPDYFEALNQDFRYQLTSIGRPQPSLYVAKEISGNRFQIAGGKPRAKVSWQVTGIRHDAFANAHRVSVEEEKPLDERGHYLHPELFGAPSEQAIDAARRPEKTARTSPSAAQ